MGVLGGCFLGRVVVEKRGEGIGVSFREKGVDGVGYSGVGLVGDRK